MWIEFEGLQNVRDLGGLSCADGRHVRFGRLLRGAGLSQATDADAAVLAEKYRLRHIVDFRGDPECEKMPDRPIPGAAYHHFPAMTRPAAGAPVPETTEEQPDFGARFRGVYRRFVDSEQTAAAYRSFFRVLTECTDGAVYFHCSQGKDRTGIGAILLLTALGVRPEEVTEDFFLSNEALRPMIDREDPPGAPHWSRETKEQLYLVFPETLALFTDGVRERWGGLDGYLRDAIGLTDADRERLQRQYLE